MKHAADFIRASGIPVGYTNWSPGQPDNSPAFGGEYYGIIQSYAYPRLIPGDWNDNSNTASNESLDDGVVEVVSVPEPTSLFLMAAAAIDSVYLRGRRYFQPF